MPQLFHAINRVKLSVWCNWQPAACIRFRIFGVFGFGRILCVDCLLSLKCTHSHTQKPNAFCMILCASPRAGSHAKTCFSNSQNKMEMLTNCVNAFNHECTNENGAVRNNTMREFIIVFVFVRAQTNNFRAANMPAGSAKHTHMRV